MKYDKGTHLDWWHSLPSSERFPLMRKHNVEQVTNKLIYKMFKVEFKK
jgi:hypothetical protein